MLTLEMHIDGQCIDTVLPCSIELQHKGDRYLALLKEELLKKHAAALLKVKEPPEFILTGVASLMNNFTPLKHPSTR